MNKRLKYLLYTVLLSFLVTAACVVHSMRWLPWQAPAFDTQMPPHMPKVNGKAILIFSKTNGFRHQSIGPGITAIKKACGQNGWQAYATENGALINTQFLSQFKAVVFLSTTGEILTPSQKAAFEKYIENGGGYAGIHSAADTEHHWPWYGQWLGTFFRSHTVFPFHLPEGEIITESADHPANTGLPARWEKTDEWYNFRDNIRGREGFQVLLSLNEQSYPSFWPKMNGDHPVSWVHSVGKARMFYTALGHNAETFTDPNAMLHIIGGIRWAGNL